MRMGRVFVSSILGTIISNATTLFHFNRKPRQSVVLIMRTNFNRIPVAKEC